MRKSVYGFHRRIIADSDVLFRFKKIFSHVKTMLCFSHVKFAFVIIITSTVLLFFGYACVL